MIWTLCQTSWPSTPLFKCYCLIKILIFCSSETNWFCVLAKYFVKYFLEISEFIHQLNLRSTYDMHFHYSFPSESVILVLSAVSGIEPDLSPRRSCNRSCNHRSCNRSCNHRSYNHRSCNHQSCNHRSCNHRSWNRSRCESIESDFFHRHHMSPNKVPKHSIADLLVLKQSR